jgi:cysteine-S-conjugate beta-lyase
MDSTSLIHHSYTPPSGFNAPQAATHKASTVIFESVAAMRARDWKNKDGYTYGLHGTPTTFALEARIASLEGGSHCLLTPSGLASIACVNIALLKSGDEVLIPSNCYGPNLAMAQNELANWGITHQVYDAMNPVDLAARLSSSTKLVWLEAAGSVTMEFPDLAALSKLCKAQGMTTALDNTWGAGLAFNAFDYADITVHALTKYPSGSANLLMGSVVTQSEALYQKIRFSHMHLGWGVGANDVEQVLVGLNTILLRYAAQDQAARGLATYLQTCTEIAQVLHPALESALGHAAWQRICTDKHGVTRAAGIFSVIFQPDFTQAQIDHFCESLQFFKLGYSWAGPMSLVVPYDLKTMRPEWPAGVASGCLVRFCIGLEAVTDLQQDLAQALQTLRENASPSSSLSPRRSA